MIGTRMKVIKDNRHERVIMKIMDPRSMTVFLNPYYQNVRVLYLKKTLTFMATVSDIV